MNEVSPAFDLWNATPRRLEVVLRKAVISALRAHKRAGVPAIVWDREKRRIVSVPPEEIPEYTGRDDPNPPSNS